MRNLILGFSAAALICIAGFVAAQSTRPEPRAEAPAEVDRGTRRRLAAMDTSEAAFRRLDQDNDGRISALEAAENPRVAAAFTLADKDKDGYLSKEEFESLRSSGTHPDVDASSPNGDRVSDPSGDQPATDPGPRP